jgi:uncharacterized protein (TIRG00374 family)
MTGSAEGGDLAAWKELPSRQTDALPSRKRLARGAAWFAILTLTALAVVFAVTWGPETLASLGNLRTPFLVGALVLVCSDVLIGALRYQIFIRRIRPDSSLWLPVRADLANRFVGSVTPSQTGGGPAQLYVLHRGGVPVADSLSFLAINLVSTLVFFIGAGGLAVYGLREILPPVAKPLGWYALLTCGTMLALLLVALLKPEWIQRWSRPLVGLWPFQRGEEGAHRLSGWLETNLNRYRNACTAFIREEPRLLLWSFGLTSLLYLNKFMLAWMVMRGLGVEEGLIVTLSVQAVLHALVYVAPSPGGAGIAELLTAILMAALVPTQLLGVFTVTYRLLQQYLPAMVGGLVLAALFRPGAGQARSLVSTPSRPGSGSL